MMANEMQVLSYVRLRPLTLMETRSQFIDIVDNTRIVVETPSNIKCVSDFSFDYIFPEETKQAHVYEKVVHPLIKEVVSGYNCTIFAYGQTGSGKTYTISGNQTESAMEEAGIVPRAIEDLYNQLQDMNTEFSVKILFLELYNEKFRSLVSEETDIALLTDLCDNVHVKGVKWKDAPDQQTALKIFFNGSQRKQMAKTEMNLTSSRSHTIFSVTVRVTESNGAEDIVRTGKFNLIDLAGSEHLSKDRPPKTARTDDDTISNTRALETKKINQSLYSLGRVITAIVENHDHVPYRGSKLTHFLKDSLGGNSKTAIIGTISLSNDQLYETISTLRYTCEAQKIKNKPTTHVTVTSSSFMKVASKEILELTENLHARKQGDGYFISREREEVMQRQLSDLQSQIKELNSKHNALDTENQQNVAIIDKLVKVNQNLVEENKHLKETSTKSTEINLSNLESYKVTHQEKIHQLKLKIDNIMNDEISFVGQVSRFDENVTENLSGVFSNIKTLLGDLQLKFQNFTQNREEHWRVTQKSNIKLDALKFTLDQNNMKAVDISSKWEAALEHLEKEIASILEIIKKGERDVQMAHMEGKRQLNNNLIRMKKSLNSLQHCINSGLDTIHQEAREAVKLATTSKEKADLATKKTHLIKQMVTDLEALLNDTSENVDCASKKIASLNNHSEKLRECSRSVLDQCSSDLVELYSTDFKDEATIHMQLMAKLATNLQTMSTSTKVQAKSIETLIPDIQAVSDVSALISSTEECLKAGEKMTQKFQEDLGKLSKSIETTDLDIETSLRDQYGIVKTKGKTLEDMRVSAETALKDLEEDSRNLEFIPSGAEEKTSLSPSKEFPSTSDITMSEEDKENSDTNNTTTTKRKSHKTIKNGMKVQKRNSRI